MKTDANGICGDVVVPSYHSFLWPRGRSVWGVLFGYAENGFDTDWTADRMIGYLRHYDNLPMENVADEVLVILTHKSGLFELVQI